MVIAVAFAVAPANMKNMDKAATDAYDQKLFASLKLPPAKDYKAMMAHDAQRLKVLHSEAVADEKADEKPEFGKDDSLEQMYDEALKAQKDTRDRFRKELGALHLHPAFLNFDAPIEPKPSSFIETGSDATPPGSMSDDVKDELADLHKVTEHLSSLAGDFKKQSKKYETEFTHPSSLLQTGEDPKEPTIEELAPTFLKDPEQREGFKDMAAVKQQLDQLRAKIASDNRKFAVPPTSLLQTDSHFDKLSAISKKLRHIDAGLKDDIRRMRPFHLPSSFLEEVALSTSGAHITSADRVDELDEDLARLMKDDPNNAEPSSFVEVDSNSKERERNMAFLNNQARLDREFKAHEHAKERVFEHEMAHEKAKRAKIDAKTKRIYESITKGDAKKHLDDIAATINSHADDFDKEDQMWLTKLANLRKQ